MSSFACSHWVKSHWPLTMVRRAYRKKYPSASSLNDKIRVDSADDFLIYTKNEEISRMSDLRDKSEMNDNKTECVTLGALAVRRGTYRTAARENGWTHWTDG